MPTPSEDDLARRDLTRALDGFRGDPRRALRLPAAATPADVRRAFRELAKRYHPARFARRDPAIVRLANEVFLAMREAQDLVLVELSATPGIRATTAARGDPTPVPKAAAAVAPAQGAAPARARRPTPGYRPMVSPTPAVPARPPAPAPAPTTPSTAKPTPSSGRPPIIPPAPTGPSAARPPIIPPAPSARPPIIPPAPSARPPIIPPAPAPRPPIIPPAPSARPPAPSPRPPIVPPAPTTPAAAPPTRSRPATIPTPSAPAPTAGPRPQAARAPTPQSSMAPLPSTPREPPSSLGEPERPLRQRPVSTVPGKEPRFTASDVKAAADSANQARDRFERALDAIRRQKWAEARTELEQLIAAAPGDNRYRAYLHYVNGWNAFQLGRDGDARTEWQKALACDPGLGMARWALESTGLLK